MKHRQVLRIGLAAGLVLGGAALSLRVFARAPSARAQPGRVHEKIVSEALVTAQGGVAEVRARVEGRVLRVLVREGDSVEAGQVLAELEPDEQRLVVAVAEAEEAALEARESAVVRGSRSEEVRMALADVRAKEAAQAIALDRAERARHLHDEGAMADSSFYEAERTAELAKASTEHARSLHALARQGSRDEDVSAMAQEVTAARHRRAQAELRLSYTQVVAPIAGVIVGRHVDEGDTVLGAPGPTLLFELSDPTRTELMIEVEESDAERMMPGLEVTVTTPGGGRVLASATVERVNARVRPRTIGASLSRVRAETGVRPLWARFDDTRGTLLSIGTRVEAVLSLPPRDVRVMAPRAAVQIRDGAAVLSVRGLVFSEQRTVTLGAADERFVEVEGIEPGTEIELVE